jgi:hypothetical protein
VRTRIGNAWGDDSLAKETWHCTCNKSEVGMVL